MSFFHQTPITNHQSLARHGERGFSLLEVMIFGAIMLVVLIWSGIFSPPKSEVVSSKIHYMTGATESNKKNLQITDMKFEESTEDAPTPTPTRSI